MAKRNEILSRYSQAAQLADARNQRLTPAEYMLASSPGENEVRYRGKVYYSKYRNADSASRAFRKIRSGETSGERIFAEAETKYPKPAARGEKGKDLGFRLEKGRGGRQVGLWKVTVFMAWTDANGDEQGREYEEVENRYGDTEERVVYDYNTLEARSFIVETMNYTSSLDAKTVEYEVADAIDDHVAAWEDSYGVSSVEVVYVEVVKIETYHVHSDNVYQVGF